jgi:hypothetical protein
LLRPGFTASSTNASPVATTVNNLIAAGSTSVVSCQYSILSQWNQPGYYQNEKQVEAIVLMEAFIS